MTTTLVTFEVTGETLNYPSKSVEKLADRNWQPLELADRKARTFKVVAPCGREDFEAALKRVA